MSRSDNYKDSKEMRIIVECLKEKRSTIKKIENGEARSYTDKRKSEREERREINV